jgi:hypothetical protein
MSKAVITLSPSEYLLLMASLRLAEIAINDEYYDDVCKTRRLIGDKTVWINDEKEEKSAKSHQNIVEND